MSGSTTRSPARSSSAPWKRRNSIEIARFFSSLACFNPALDRYEIRGVMSPDEYHDSYPGTDRPGLDNNAYTNVMTAWLLRRALEALELLDRKSTRLNSS